MGKGSDTNHGEDLDVTCFRYRPVTSRFFSLTCQYKLFKGVCNMGKLNYYLGESSRLVTLHMLK